MAGMGNRAEMARMQISLTGTDVRVGRSSGFTLIELTVALAIIVIVTGAAVISVSAGVTDAKMRSGCRMTASVLNYARSHAVTTGKTTRVAFVEGRTIEVEEQVANTTGDSSSDDSQFKILTTSAGKAEGLPDGIGVTRLVKRSGAQDENWIEFDKLGQTEPAVVELADTSNMKRYVVVDPITGRCRVETDIDEVVNGW